MVMFFGMCNSPATFQSMMNDIFKDFLDEGWIVIYMDNILIFLSTTVEHQEQTRKVLLRLRDNDLFAKWEKSHFDTNEVEFLGMIVRPGFISMDPVKLAGIQDWPIPKNVKGVRSFLGFGNFYRKFILGYSSITRPLNALTQKNLQWEWTSECQSAFEKLKNKFLTAPVLKMADPNSPFVIESDASMFATGAVLRQKDLKGDWHPCGFISHSLTPEQRNYQIYDRELLAVILALQEWRHYLHGSPHPITILTDHKNLTYFRTAQKLNPRQARWSLMLSMFDLVLIHAPVLKWFNLMHYHGDPTYIPATTKVQI